MRSPPGRDRGPHPRAVYDGQVELRGILFDLDGTLADTAAAEREAWPSLAAVIERHAPMVDPGDLHGRYYGAFERHWTAFVDGEIDFAEYRRRRLSEALEPWCEVTDELYAAYRAEKRRGVERLRLFDDALPTLRRRWHRYPLSRSRQSAPGRRQRGSLH